MKAIVYTSNTETSQQYAQLLSQKLNIPVYSLKDAKSKLNSGDEIIYFGWLMAGKIKGYKAASKKYRIAAVCGVGMGKNGSQVNEVRKANHISAESALFILQGGFDISKLHGIYKLMMISMSKTVGKALSEKENKTPEESEMLELLLNGGCRVCEENLSELLNYLNS